MSGQVQGGGVNRDHPCHHHPWSHRIDRESCDNRKLDAVLCPKCPATGIACIYFIILGKFSGNLNVGGIFEEMLAN